MKFRKKHAHKTTFYRNYDHYSLFFVCLFYVNPKSKIHHFSIFKTRKCFTYIYDRYDIVIMIIDVCCCCLSWIHYLFTLLMIILLIIIIWLQLKHNDDDYNDLMKWWKIHKCHMTRDNHDIFFLFAYGSNFLNFFFHSY